ncbi:MAG: hypothetical protein J2P57_10970 [Acidimicrobiaceae bacterium]|nr:hypothetical protein [Acidimicrobiaceae bacterium]
MTKLRGAERSGDPLARASWRFRWQWRRLERRVAGDETRRLLASLRGWRLDGHPVEVDVVTDAERVTTAVLRHAGWRAELGHVTRCGREALLIVSRVGQAVALRDAGRYGPFWWVSVGSGPEGAVVLGATLRLVPEGGWGGGERSVGGPPGRVLTVDPGPTAPVGLVPA